MQKLRSSEDGFTLVELLVVVVIIGILAAIAIPRFLSQREEANNATAISDLRNLIAQETAFEATSTGLTDNDFEIADAGWSVTAPAVVVCANLDTSGGTTDLTLTAWHEQGSVVYTWQRSSPRMDGTKQELPSDCFDGSLGEDVTDDQYPTPGPPPP